jgi:hypothetical protein
MKHCGDNCKGECSGEVDGIVHCPDPVDIFERVENKVTGFIARHKWVVRVVIFPIVVITFAALAFVLFTSQIGYGLVLIMLQGANAGESAISIPVTGMDATDEIIETWENVIHPIATFLFYWVYAITLLIPITYIGRGLYLASRYTYRKTKGV